MTRNWHLVDVKGQILGRIATRIATLLMGKHKPSYTPHIESGDYVVVINAAEVAVTGKKKSDKLYHSHSGFPGGLSSASMERVQERFPERIIAKAVYNMLPANRLRVKRMNRLKIYAGSEHQHQAQLGK